MRKTPKALPPPAADRIVTAAERRQLVPYSDTHIKRLERAGLFPKRLKLNDAGRRIGWLKSEVDAWLAARANAR